MQVALADGRRLAGVARNSSNWALQMVDREGRLHLLERREWRDVQWPGGSLMPNDYGKTLSAKELEAVLAFLGRQSTGKPVVRRRRAE